MGLSATVSSTSGHPKNQFSYIAFIYHLAGLTGCSLV